MSKIALLRTKSFLSLFMMAFIAIIGITFALDTDNDGAEDSYEDFFNLNPTNSVDAGHDYDSDLLNNAAESVLWTDPWVGDTDADGFGDSTDDNPLSRAVIMWGHPDYTTGDTYAYTGPQWWTGAGKSGGIWAASEHWELPAQEQGELYIDLDRAALSSNLVLGLLYESSTNSTVTIALEDASGAIVATNLFGDITGDDNTQVLNRYALPLTDYPTATRIVIDAEKGTQAYKVWAASLYIDADGDGLDADQELQIGTLDTTPDYDLDMLSDYVEAIIYGTDPLDPDTDGDGFSDGEEVARGSSPTVPAWQEGGVPGTLTVERWNDVPGFHVSNMTDSEKFGTAPDAYSWVSTSEYSANIGGACAIRMRGTITAPSDGEYTFWLTGDDAAEVWLSETDSPYGRKRIAELKGWTNYRQLSSWRVNPSEPITHSSNQTCYIEVLFKEGGGADHVTLWWTRPEQTNPEIIGAEYLHSYVQPNDDQDMDGLPDTLEIAAGLNPQDGTGGGYADTDGDGYSDHKEINRMGTSPTIPSWKEGGVAGTLTVEQWNDIPGFNISDLVGCATFGGAPDEVIPVLIAEYTKNSGWACGGRIRGTITAPVAGDYIFQLTGDDSAQVWLSDTASPYGRKQILDLDGWTNYRELSSWRVPVSESITLSSNQTCYVEILFKEGGGADHVTLWWTRPGRTIPQVIGTKYIHSYVQPSDDQDGDGLPDAWETACGLDPLDGGGGGYRDTDGDLHSDIAEYQLGLDPLVVDADADGLKGGDEVTLTLTDPNNADTDGDGTPDRIVHSSINGAATLIRHDSSAASRWSTSGTSVVLDKLESWSGNSFVVYKITAPEPGIHQLTVHASWANGVPALEDRALMAVLVDGNMVETIQADRRGIYTLYTPWLTVGSHRIKCYLLPSGGYTEGLSLDRIDIASIDGADANGDGLQDWMQARMGADIDSDDDGISDADEILLYGSDPLDADTDRDGLSDGDELVAGTDMLDEDSDNDGVVDGVEVHETLTNPLAMEFDGTITVVATVTGSQTNNAVGTWEIEGNEIVAKRRRGFVEYKMNFPNQDLYGLNISAAHLWNKSSCNPVAPVDTSALQISVDGTYVGSYPLVSTDGVYSDVRAFLPVLPAGEHTVRIFWENTNRRLSLKINKLQLQSLGGPDSDGNGTKDWVETSITSMAGVDAVVESFVSPACIEGPARYVPMMDIVSQASSLPCLQSTGSRWYANLPLDEDAITTATASFQNGALEVPVNVEWVAYNIIDHAGETILVRKGDMVKFVALPEEAHGGQFEIEYTLGMDGETVRSPNTRPLIYLFPSAGSYTVTGQYTHGNDTVTASITVVAIDGAFPAANPACLVGREREWSFEGIPANAVLEVDGTVELAELSTTNQALRTISLKANNTNGEHVMLARLYPGGPVLDSTRLSTFWIQNAVDGYFWTVERYEDSELWEVEMVTKQVPDSVDIEIKVFVAGVTLDDYSLERWLTHSDLDEIGEYDFRLFHPNDAELSVCHTVKVYQDGVYVGEAYGAGKEDIDEE